MKPSEHVHANICVAIRDRNLDALDLNLVTQSFARTCKRGHIRGFLDVKFVT